MDEQIPFWADESPLDPEITVLIEKLIQAVINERADARNAKDFARADALRVGLEAAGVIVMDSAEGSTWDLAPDFDPTKLEALK